ncbi:hypothetical protein VNO78_31415 [Psophocarpus tetragonolobus]|uniref:Uncharacterized protein n=1 Tax=Psophocarpus tetragonolobus TaxID=3891 RepID=A0AAN9RYG8_PSOTE
MKERHVSFPTSLDTVLGHTIRLSFADWLIVFWLDSPFTMKKWDMKLGKPDPIQMGTAYVETSRKTLQTLTGVVNSVQYETDNGVERVASNAVTQRISITTRQIALVDQVLRWLKLVSKTSIGLKAKFCRICQCFQFNCCFSEGLIFEK